MIQYFIKSEFGLDFSDEDPYSFTYTFGFGTTLVVPKENSNSFICLHTSNIDEEGIIFLLEEIVKVKIIIEKINTVRKNKVNVFDIISGLYVEETYIDPHYGFQLSSSSQLFNLKEALLICKNYNNLQWKNYKNMNLCIKIANG